MGRGEGHAIGAGKQANERIMRRSNGIAGHKALRWLPLCSLPRRAIVVARGAETRGQRGTRQQRAFPSKQRLQSTHQIGLGHHGHGHGGPLGTRKDGNARARVI